MTVTRRQMLVSLAVAPLAACAGARSDAPGSAIRIGGLFALSGEDAALDRPTADGARLAAREINTAGGVLGRSLELIVRDTRTAPETTRRAAERMVAEDRVTAVVGFANTDPLLAAAPAIAGAGLPFVTPGATSPRIPAQAGPRVFLACFGDNAQAAAGAEFAARFGKRAYVLANTDVEYTRLLARYFKTRWRELGGTVVLESWYQDRTTAFTTHIAQLRTLPQPDVLYVAAMAYDAGIIIKEIRAAGFTVPIVGGDAYDAPEVPEAAGAAGKDVYFTTHALMDGPDVTPGVRGFAQAYRAAYGRAPESAFAALGHDAMRLLADAIRRAGSTDGAAVQRALEATRGFDAITGAISFSPENHVPTKPVTLLALRDGKFTLAAQVVPEKVPAP